MEKIFVNLTNHPSEKWGQRQVAESQQYGEVMDMPFPQIDAESPIEEVRALAKTYVDRILAKQGEVCVHIMGEMTFTFHVVTMLREKGINCVASTTERIVKEEAEGRKLVDFHFVQFRPYW